MKLKSLNIIESNTLQSPGLQGSWFINCPAKDLQVTEGTLKSKPTAILSDYIAQIQSTFKDFLKNHPIERNESLFDIFSILNIFSVNCLENDPMIPRNLHKSFIKESVKDLFELKKVKGKLKLDKSEMMFLQYVLDFTVNLIGYVGKGENSFEQLVGFLKSLFGQRSNSLTLFVYYYYLFITSPSERLIIFRLVQPRERENLFL